METRTSDRTNRPRHTVNQGVCPVDKPKMRVRRKFIMPNGQVKEEHELTPEEHMMFCQKVLDAFTPLFYERVMRDVQREKESAH